MRRELELHLADERDLLWRDNLWREQERANRVVFTPPCAPSKTGPCGPAYLTQDCQVVGATSDVLVACVNHRCMTQAAPQP